MIDARAGGISPDRDLASRISIVQFHARFASIGNDIATSMQITRSSYAAHGACASRASEAVDGRDGVEDLARGDGGVGGWDGGGGEAENGAQEDGGELHIEGLVWKFETLGSGCGKLAVVGEELILAGWRGVYIPFSL